MFASLPPLVKRRASRSRQLCSVYRLHFAFSVLNFLFRETSFPSQTATRIPLAVQLWNTGWSATLCLVSSPFQRDALFLAETAESCLPLRATVGLRTCISPTSALTLCSRLAQSNVLQARSSWSRWPGRGFASVLFRLLHRTATIRARSGAPKRIHVPAAPTFTDFRVPTFSSRGSPTPLFGWHDFPILRQRSSHQHLSTDLRSRGLKRLLLSKHSRRAFPRFRTNLTSEEAVDEIVRVPATSSSSRIPGPFPFSSNPSAAVLTSNRRPTGFNLVIPVLDLSPIHRRSCLRTSNVHGHLPLLLQPTLSFPAGPNCFSIWF